METYHSRSVKKNPSFSVQPRTTDTQFGCRTTKIATSNDWLTKNLTMQKCRWHSDWLDGAVSFRKLLGKKRVMQIRHGETLSHQGAISNEICYSSAQFDNTFSCKNLILLQKWGHARWGLRLCNFESYYFSISPFLHFTQSKKRSR